MQAMVIVDGQPQLKSLPVPVPAANQVRVRVLAASVNPADWKRASRPTQSGQVPGWDIAGSIDAIGPGVAGWKKGDPVIGFFEATGGYAQYAVASVDAIAHKPQRMTFEQAAGIPLAAVTAWKALIDVAQIQDGQRVLILGGAGGVGTAAVQIAVSRGAHVIATAAAENHPFLRGLGASELIDYHTEQFEDRVKGIDVVLNTVDAQTALRSLKVLKPGGILVSVAGTVPAEQCAMAQVRCESVDRSVGTPIGQILDATSKLADSGHYSVNVDATFTLADAQKAWQLSQTGHTRGKIVLVVSH